MSLYKVTQKFIDYYRMAGVTTTTTPNRNVVPPPNSGQVISWFQPCGEALVFLKPSDILKVVVSTDKTIYSPGDTVNYEVQVLNITTNQPASGDAYLSISVTDDSVFAQVEPRLQPPSLAARVYLENEVYRVNY